MKPKTQSVSGLVLTPLGIGAMSTGINKKCAREECGKTVYPIEELKCLDKVRSVYLKLCILPVFRSGTRCASSVQRVA
jgi:hypothetical protein